MHTHMSTIMAVKALPRFFLARSRAFMSKYHTRAISVPVAPARNGVNQGSAAAMPRCSSAPSSSRNSPIPPKA